MDTKVLFGYVGRALRQQSHQRREFTLNIKGSLAAAALTTGCATTIKGSIDSMSINSLEGSTPFLHALLKRGWTYPSTRETPEPQIRPF